MGKYSEYFLVVNFPERQVLKRCGRKWTWSSTNLGFPHISVGKDQPAMQETPVWFLGWEIRWRRARLPTSVFLGFAFGSAGKEFACHEGDFGLIPGLGRSPRERKGYPLQYSGLENSMDGIVHGVAKSRTQLSNFHFHFSLSATKDSIYFDL